MNCNAAFAFLLNLSVQFAILVIVAYAVILIFRIKDSNVRYGTWLSVTLGCTVLVLTLAIVPPPSVFPLLRSSPLVEAGAVPGMENELDGDLEVGSRSPKDRPAIQTKGNAGTIGSPEIKGTQSRRITLFGLRYGVLLLWLSGASWELLKLIRGSRHLLRLSRRSTRISDVRLDAMAREAAREMELRTSVSLKSSTDIQMPVSLGLSKPVIILPRALPERFSEEELKMILIHELAHIKRFDFLINLIQSMLGIILYFHPAFHLLKANLAKERESICDDWVIYMTGKRCAYARCLMNIGEDLTRPALGAAILGRGGSLKRRVKMLLDESRILRIRMSRSAMAILISVVCVFVPFAAMIQPVYSARGGATDLKTELIGSEAFGPASIVCKSGDYAYLCAGGALVVLDVSDPSNPTESGRINIPAMLIGIDVVGDYAYVVDKRRGLRVIDVSDPPNPEEVGFHDLPGVAYRVDVEGKYAYVTNSKEGLRIIDVSDARKPREVGRYDTPGEALGIRVLDGYAYVADKFRGLRVINVSEPSEPREVGFLETEHTAWAVYVTDSYAYVLTAGSPDRGGRSISNLRVIDISDPESPQQVGRCYVDGYSGVCVAGGYAYVAGRNEGLRVVDVSDPLKPREVGHYDTPGFTSEVYVDGDQAYLADMHGGLRVLDVSAPGNPQELGSFATPNTAYRVQVVGDHAYILADSLRIIDVSDASRPKSVATYEVPGRINAIHVVGDYAYLAGSDFRVIDISDPSNPHDVGACNPSGHTFGIHVSGKYAYLIASTMMNSNLRLIVIDISDPSDPREVEFYDTTGHTSSGYVAGNYAYVAALKGGLRVIDISDPSNIREVGFCNTPGTVQGVHVVGKYAYVTNIDEGLRVIDVSDPSRPHEVGACDTPGRAISVYVTGDRAYVADDWGGVRVMDVSDPRNPHKMEAVQTPGQAIGVYVVGNLVYVADAWAGLSILRYTE